jgi:hypothetical protein
LTLESPALTVQAMRAAIRTGAAIRSARVTRTDLLLETLALRHQLGVLARSNKRFRPADHLFWLFLRWFWPRWREALVLIQPALSIVGIAKAYADAGGVARDDLEDPASIHPVAI